MWLIKAALWTAFGLTLVACGVLLLFACDFNRPHLLDFGRKFCPATIDTNALNQEIEKGRQLREQIHAAELQLASTPPCPPPAPPRQASAPPPSPQPPGPVVGKRGRLELTLWWNTTADLDLEVACPGGYISPRFDYMRGPGICGDGTHDVDANRNMVHPVTDPKEHITWAHDIPDGDYTVWAWLNASSTGKPIQYWVRVQLDDEVKVCTGYVAWDKVTGKGYAESPIKFTLTHPLPDCNYQRKPLSRCTSGCKQ